MTDRFIDWYFNALESGNEIRCATLIILLAPVVAFAAVWADWRKGK